MKDEPNLQETISLIETMLEDKRSLIHWIHAGSLMDILALLEKQETTFEKDGHHIRCLSCGEYWCDIDREGDKFPMNFCPNCGKMVKRE